ncbi:17698_t:CDS:2, partial [Rhizophagus irregularis]
NPQGSSTVMGAGAYSEQYMTNNAYGTGINQMMPIPARPVYPIASITGNGRATAKRALGSGAQVQPMFSNMGQTSNQNQLYTTGFPNQIVGRSTVPTQSFVNTDNQNIDGKSPTPIQQNAYASSIQNINKYYGQLQKSNSIGNNFNSLLNQNQSQHSQQSNQAIHNSIQQEESQVDWLDLGDDEEVVYDFNCSTEFTSNSSGMGNNIQGIQNSSLGMLPRSPNPSSDSSRQSSVYVSQNQGQAGSQLGQFTKMAPNVNYSQPSTQSSLSTEMPSNSSIQNAIVDHYNQSPQSTVESKSNSLINLRTATQEHQGESTSILPSNDNQNSFNANVQVTSANSRITPSTDIPKDINNIPFNTEMLGTGRRNITSRQVSRQPDKTISVSNNLPLISSDQPPSIKPTHPKPPKVNYAPKTRRVDSYGGLDLRVFEKFSLPLTIPGIQDLVDVHALTMSLKCGMKLEVINALNTLTTLSYYRSAQIDLKQCGDLVDVLFDMILEYVDHVSPVNEKITEEIISQRKFKSYRELYQLSKQECEEFADVALEDAAISGDVLPLHEQCWCVINMIRNFSFTNDNNENHEYLATHPRFLTVLMRVLYIGYDDSFKLYKENDIGPDVKTKRIKAIRKKAYDILELRKSVLIILSNIAAYVPLPSIYVARDLLILIADFIDSMDDYYSQVALEVFAKLSVSYDNRQRIGGCDESTLISFFNCLVQMLPKGENNIITGGGGRLMAQELPYLIMSFYNFACLSGEGMRKKIISTPGFINRMLKMSILLAHNRDEDCIMLARRAMETLKVLAKGNEESFLVYTEQLLSALLNPYIDPVVVKDLESVMYPGDV